MGAYEAADSAAAPAVEEALLGIAAAETDWPAHCGPTSSEDPIHDAKPEIPHKRSSNENSFYLLQNIAQRIFFCWSLSF